MQRRKFRSAYKPHSVWRANPPGWTSIWTDGYPSAQAVYPEMIGKRAFPALWASLLLDLAPHGGCLSGCIAAPAGGLLHRLFTLTHLLRVSGMLSVALVQALMHFRALPGMLPCGVRTFLGHIHARVHPADLDSYYTVNMLEKYRKMGNSE